MPSYNLLEISRIVSDELGRPELVVNFGTDYTPTSRFLRLINAASRRLDRRVDTHNEWRRWRGNLVAGQYLLDIPKDVQHIDEIDIEADGQRYKLEMRDEFWMRRNYDEPFSVVQNDRPLDWSRWTPTGLYGESLIKNSDFSSTTTDWTAIAGSVTVSGGKLRLQSSGASAAMEYEFDEPQDLIGAIFSFDVVGMADSADLYYVSFFNGADDYLIQPLSTDGQFLIEDIIQYYVEQGLDADDLREAFRSIDKIQVAVVASSGDWIDLDNIKLINLQSSAGNVLVLPPADKEYAVNVRARVWSTDFVNNTDRTWWSNRNPDILITAIKRQIAEELNRNRTEVEEYDAVLAEQLYELEKCMAAEEQSGDRGSNRMGYMQ